jgi:hypothetical protein
MDAEELRRQVEGLPLYVAETRPGDVIAFDWHLRHTSIRGRDRRQWTVSYVRDPTTAEERAAFTDVVIDGNLAFLLDDLDDYDHAAYPPYDDHWLAPARPIPSGSCSATACAPWACSRWWSGPDPAGRRSGVLVVAALVEQVTQGVAQAVEGVGGDGGVDPLDLADPDHEGVRAGRAEPADQHRGPGAGGALVKDQEAGPALHRLGVGRLGAVGLAHHLPLGRHRGPSQLQTPLPFGGGDDNPDGSAHGRAPVWRVPDETGG